MEKHITLTREIAAPRERVWQAWTDPKQVQAWWAPNGFTNPVCEVDARVGGEISIVMEAGDNLGEMSGMKAPMQGTFTEVTEPEKLAFSTVALDEAGNHLLEGATTVMLEDMDGKTKLTVETGVTSVAPGTDQMVAGMEQGWNEQLDKLVAFLR